MLSFAVLTSFIISWYFLMFSVCFSSINRIHANFTTRNGQVSWILVSSAVAVAAASEDQKSYRQRLTIELRVILTGRWSRRRKKKRKTAKQHHQEQEEPIAHHERMCSHFLFQSDRRVLPESGCSVVPSQSGDADAVVSMRYRFSFFF